MTKERRKRKETKAKLEDRVQALTGMLADSVHANELLTQECDDLKRELGTSQAMNARLRADLESALAGGVLD